MRSASFEIWCPPCDTSLTPLPPNPLSLHVTDAQNLVKQYAFYMKRALVRLARVETERARSVVSQVLTTI